jgi:hypothetical protein
LTACTVNVRLKVHVFKLCADIHIRLGYYVVDLLTVVCNFRDRDAKSYMKDYANITLLKWTSMDSECRGGILILVSMTDSLVTFREVLNYCDISVY